MRNTSKLTSCLIGAAVLLSIPMTSSAYEVNFLTGAGSESRNLEKGRYEIAIERLERRLQTDTRDRDIKLTNLCTAYVVTGNYGNAAPVCDEAVALDGRFVGAAYNSRGVMNALTGDYIAALDDFGKAADPRNYQRPRAVWGEQAPSMKRFETPDAKVERSIGIAAGNRNAADRVWATTRTTD